MKQAVLKDGEIVLRRPKESDIESRFKCGRNDEITFMYGGEKKESKYTQESAKKWYKVQLERSPGWVIEYNGECIGEIFLHHLDEKAGSARIALGIFNSEYLGKGIGTKAIKLVVDYAFNELGLKKIDLKVLDYNKRAIRAYKKAGFKEEEVLERSDFIRGKWRNDIVMSIKNNQ